MHALTEFIIGLGWIAVAAVIFAESGLLVGFFLPGDSLIFTAGFLAQQGIFDINIHLLVLILFLSAAIGDSTGYAFGRRVGRKLFKKQNSKFFHQENLQRAEKFYKDHGSKTIILARFVPFVRTFAPIVAGISNMHYRTFLFFNIIGAALWTAGFSYLGYYAGAYIEKLGINIEVAAIIIVILSVAPGVYHVLKEPEGRAGVKNLIVSIKNKLLRKQ